MRALVALLLVGCGSNEGNSNPASDAGAEVVVDSAPDTANPLIGKGVISVSQRKTDEATLAARTTAAFAREVPQTVPATCTRESVGPCDVLACAPSPPPESPAYEGAGTLTLSKGLLIAPLEVPRAGRTYAHAATNEPYFKGSDDLVVKATGGVVPPFELSVTTPLDLAVSKPACAADCGEIDRAKDYEIVWAPPRFGSVDVIVFTNAPGTGYTRIACSVAATDGRLVIPAAALAKLRTDATMATIDILPRSTEVATISGWKLTFVTTANGPSAPVTIK